MRRKFLNVAKYVREIVMTSRIYYSQAKDFHPCIAYVVILIKKRFHDRLLPAAILKLYRVIGSLTSEENLSDIAKNRSGKGRERRRGETDANAGNEEASRTRSNEGTEQRTLRPISF